MSYGINPATGRCRQCGKLQYRMETNGMGRAFEVPAPCLCPKEAPKRAKRTPAWRATVDNDRRRACICQLCDEPVHGKPKVSLYCPTHRSERERAAAKRWSDKAEVKPWQTYAERNREKLRKRARAHYQKEPAERERRNAYKRAWRKLNRDKIRAQKERAALRNFRDPAPTVRRWRERVEAGEHKPKPARTNKHGQRLCVSPYCRQVMEGRAKKCERCKAREAEQARQALVEIRRAA